MKNNGFSIFTQFLLWFFALLSFGALLNAIGNLPPSLEEGIPLWVAILWILVPLGLLVSVLGIIFQRRLGGYGLIATIITMVPTYVAINYYTLLITGAEEVDFGWFVTSTLFFIIFGAIIGGIIFLAIRTQWPGFR